jgi:hypothetical protein
MIDDPRVTKDHPARVRYTGITLARPTVAVAVAGSHDAPGCECVWVSS